MPSIDLQNVNFYYPLFLSRGKSLFKWNRRVGAGSYHCLRDINLSIRDGERVALIGRNGSGKSTLLRLMAGVYKPDRGICRRIGRTFAIIDSGLGLNPVFTGRENIHTLGLLVGMTDSELQRKIPEIIDFVDLGEFFDEPVSTYSTGMRARLGFAVNTMVRPDILLSDEYLGTGDIFFREKVKEKIEGLFQSNIVVIASHSQTVLDTICNRAILMEKGEIVFDGELKEAQDIYHDMYNATL